MVFLVPSSRPSRLRAVIGKNIPQTLDDLQKINKMELGVSRATVRENVMSSDSIFKAHWNDASEADVSYTRLCVPALVSAFFGVGTFLVFFDPWFFFLGVIAIVLGLFALWAIHSAEGLLTGKSLAYVGLCSAVVALVSVAVFWAAYQHSVRREADQFFRLWFAAVLEGDVPRAKEYQSLYSNRSKAATAEEWWQAQYEEKYAHRAIHLYVEDKLIRVLMALGDQAKVSYYKTERVVSERESDTVVSIYAVTFPGEFGRTETFFVRIGGKRAYPHESTNFRAAGWRLDGTPAFHLPEKMPPEKIL